MQRLRIGFVGVGHRGRGNLASLLKSFPDRAEVKALADPDEANLREAAGLVGQDGAALCADWRDLVSRDDVDAVCISTPQDSHCPIAVESLRSGKHVYCEKPLALTLRQCDEMLGAAREARRVFLVGQQMRYHAHLRRMSELIDEGAIGEPAMMWLKEWRNPFPEHMKWAFDKSRSGGAVVEKSCHHFDVFAWMLRRPIRRVHAVGGQAVHREIFGVPSSVVDHAWATCEHDGGGKSMLGLCFFAGPPHRLEGGAGTHARDIGVIGTEGIIVTEGFTLGRNLELRRAERSEVRRIEVNPPSTPPDVLQRNNGNWGIWADFLGCVETGGVPFARAEIGREALAAALAAERSIEKGGPVRVDEVG